MRRIVVFFVLLLAATVGFTGVGAAASTSSSAAALTGAKEVPGPGDADGIGFAVTSPRPGQSTVCIDIRYRNIDPPTGAHIHDAPPGVVGPIVIDFTGLIATSPAGRISGCVAVDPALAQDVAQNAAEFYVNVHNVAFPAGAIRGQLRG